MPTDIDPRAPVRVIDPSGGANQSRVREWNERLVLSLVRRHERLPKAEIARRSGLSAQTVSVIMRALEEDDLLSRGAPIRGKVGQPSIPMALNPDGVFSIGLKIGRRSADLVLMDFVGGVRSLLHETFRYPVPGSILAFVVAGVETLRKSLPEAGRRRIAGIGVATPFELWNWLDEVGAPRGEMDAWRGYDLAAEIAVATGLPVHLQNDATAACGAELVFGRGREFSDFAYFFIGSFIGGGVVLNQALYPGRTGNAGAFGSLPVPGPDGAPRQLIDCASLFVLEARLRAAGIDPSPLWLNPDDWTDFGAVLDRWIEDTGAALAIAIASVSSVIDFEAALIDGGFPAAIRARIVAATRAGLERLDLQGITPPVVAEAAVGSRARAIGAASLPLFARYLTDQNVLFKEMG
ncbi:MAG TPA: ROK family transcriptional regulator [Rhizobiaceae bacterium]|nr:ROK family transcriptional regulator [Rhizobiaceae bacterium]